MKRGQFLVSKEKELEMKNVLFAALIAVAFAAPVAAKDGPPPYLYIEMEDGENFTRLVSDRCWQVASAVAKGKELEADFLRCVRMSGKVMIIDTRTIEGMAAFNRRMAERTGYSISFPYEAK